MTHLGTRFAERDNIRYQLNQGEQVPAIRSFIARAADYDRHISSTAAASFSAI